MVHPRRPLGLWHRLWRLTLFPLIGTLAILPATANIVGEENRRYLTPEVAAELGLTPEEYEQALACNVVVDCPDKKNPTSGAIAGEAGKIATGSHLFMNPEGKPHPHRAGCRIHNFKYPRDFIEVSVDAAELALRKSWKADMTQDGLSATPKKRPKGCTKPYPLDETETVLEPGHEVLVISAHPEGMLGEDGLPIAPRYDLPVAQLCHIKRAIRPSNPKPTVYYTDCDGGNGASGGLLFADMGGRRYPKAVVSRGGPADVDGEDYSEERGSGTAFVAIDFDFLDLVMGRPIRSAIPDTSAAAVSESPHPAFSISQMIIDYRGPGNPPEVGRIVKTDKSSWWDPGQNKRYKESIDSGSIILTEESIGTKLKIDTNENRIFKATGSGWEVLYDITPMN
ncbi:MAG: hypothetical protein ACRECX_12560 [Methyloceanibacter sp.]